MNKTATTIIILLIIIGGGYFLLRNNDTEINDDQMENMDQTTSETSMKDDGTILDTSTDTSVDTTVKIETPLTVGEVKEIVIDSSNFKFSTSEITVNQGDKVKIILKNGDGTHDLFLDGYKLKTKILNKPGEIDSIEFVASTKGTFEYYCTIGSHRAMGMTGNLIVK